MSPMRGSGIIFSLGQLRSCESESEIPNPLPRICGEPAKIQPNSEATTQSEVRSYGGGVAYQSATRERGQRGASLHFVAELNASAEASRDSAGASWRVTAGPTHEHVAHQSE